MANAKNSNMLGQEIVMQKTLTIANTDAIISGKKERISIYLRNISTDGSRISIQFSNVDAAADNTGIVLNSNEFIIDANSEGYKCWSGDIHAISNTGTGVLSIVER